MLAETERELDHNPTVTSPTEMLIMIYFKLSANIRYNWWVLHTLCTPPLPWQLGYVATTSGVKMTSELAEIILLFLGRWEMKRQIWYNYRKCCQSCISWTPEKWNVTLMTAGRWSSAFFFFFGWEGGVKNLNHEIYLLKNIKCTV